MGAGAQFPVSPGTTTTLLERLLALPVPVLPGVATVGEALSVLERGITSMKFFPAAQAGGPAYLAVISTPVPQIRFRPTAASSALSVPGILAVADEHGADAPQGTLSRHLAGPPTAQS